MTDDVRAALLLAKNALLWTLTPGGGLMETGKVQGALDAIETVLLGEHLALVYRIRHISRDLYWGLTGWGTKLDSLVFTMDERQIRLLPLHGIWVLGAA